MTTASSIGRVTTSLIAGTLVVGFIDAAAFAGTCDVTTEKASAACMLKADSDFDLALGKCANFSTVGEREACDTQARRKRVGARNLCDQQTQARGKVCKALGQAPYDPTIRPGDFVNEVTNPYFPLKPGTIFTYRSEDGVVRVEVTNKTKTILGVECVVVHDTKRVDGMIEEDTLDYFAQDKDGNVWYFGETTAEYKNGQPVSTAGSWIAGKDGAKPGIIMPASPKIGVTYRQEFLLGEAEDLARVEARGERVAVPFGRFDNALKTFDFTPLEPEAKENKYYVRGVGLVLTVNRVTGEREELVRVEQE
jgi:hypothetical protein